jgi:4-carboxymuconolactone decarboxylase
MIKEQTMADSEARQRGQAVIKQLFGQERDMSNPTAWDEITLDHLFGTIWSRPQLPIRDRSLIVVAALTALGKEPQLKRHLQGALNQGITREQIIEIMIHLAHYAGWPAAVNGQRVARELFAELDAQS